MDIDSLKRILSKADNGGISLEKVLNKPQQEAVVNTEDEDPGENLFTLFVYSFLTRLSSWID